jgi:hypothetical protein
MTPYRVLLVELILMLSSLLYCCLTCARSLVVRQIHVLRGVVGCYYVNVQPVPTAVSNDFPHSQILLMALMDTIQLFGLVISAAGVTPTMTVILLHVSTPCVVFSSHWLFPNRKYSLIQLRGVAIIAAAVIVCIARVTYYYFFDPLQVVRVTLWSSVWYVVFAAVQGFITVYKEWCIISWSRPLDIYRLSAWLFYYQSMIGIVISPLAYLLQGARVL